MKHEITRLMALINTYGVRQVSLAAEELLSQKVYGVNHLERLMEKLEKGQLTPEPDSCTPPSQPKPA